MPGSFESSFFENTARKAAESLKKKRVVSIFLFWIDFILSEIRYKHSAEIAKSKETLERLYGSGIKVSFKAEFTQPIHPRKIKQAVEDFPVLRAIYQKLKSLESEEFIVITLETASTQYVQSVSCSAESGRFDIASRIESWCDDFDYQIEEAVQQLECKLLSVFTPILHVIGQEKNQEYVSIKFAVLPKYTIDIDKGEGGDIYRLG